jgi:SAM-dependent methyltransferase
VSRARAGRRRERRMTRADGRRRRKAGAPDQPRLYRDLAAWWPLISAPEEYDEEAALYAKAMIAACDRRPRTVLELGSGGGNNAVHLKKRFAMTLVDLSAGMLGVSRRLNPECEHLEGDMRSLRLGRQFDCVFVHDALVYMASERDLRRAIETAFVHCRPGGAALFAPDDLRETFRPGTLHGGNDGDGRAARYLEWVWDPDPSDTTFLTDYTFVLRDRRGTVRVEHDRHVCGLFARAQWLRWLSAAGFRARLLRLPSTLDPPTAGLFVAKRPAA